MNGSIMILINEYHPIAVAIAHQTRSLLAPDKIRLPRISAKFQLLKATDRVYKLVNLESQIDEKESNRCSFNGLVER